METTDILNTFLALVFVLALMGLIALIAKRMGLTQNGITGKNKRLKIVDSLALDPKHRAVILQCDHKQHLVILSHNGETIVEQNLDVRHEKTEDAKPFE